MAQKKRRLDVAVHEQHPTYSKRQVQSWIMQGNVFVNGEKVTKAGAQVKEDVIIDVKFEEQAYVGRAGFKLERALDHFSIDVQGLVCLDAGISTGGFTDCLLQRGAKKVFGIDVGYGQVHEKIRTDERVVLLERTNLRYVRVSDIGEQVDLVSLDLSFISLLKVLDAVCSVLKDGGKLVTLIKPQFEADKASIGRGGIIKDPSVHERVIKHVTEGIVAKGFTCVGVIPSPIQGAQGNKEFLGYWIKND